MLIGLGYCLTLGTTGYHLPHPTPPLTSTLRLYLRLLALTTAHDLWVHPHLLAQPRQRCKWEALKVSLFSSRLSNHSRRKGDLCSLTLIFPWWWRSVSIVYVPHVSTRSDIRNINIWRNASIVYVPQVSTRSSQTCLCSFRI